MRQNQVAGDQRVSSLGERCVDDVDERTSVYLTSTLVDVVNHNVCFSFCPPDLSYPRAQSPHLHTASGLRSVM
jgi:hypothetical protein